MKSEVLTASKVRLTQQAEPSSQATGTAPAGRNLLRLKPRETPVDPIVRVIGELQRRFPHAFPKKLAPKLPLKIGIHEDLLKHAHELSLTEQELRAAIKVWCRSRRYRECLVEGAMRRDLTGTPVGPVQRWEATPVATEREMPLNSSEITP